MYDRIKGVRSQLHSTKSYPKFRKPLGLPKWFSEMLEYVKILKTQKTSSHRSGLPTPLPSSIADDLHILWQHSWLNRREYVEDPMIGDWRPRFMENDTEFYSLHPRLRDFLNDRFGHDK